MELPQDILGYIEKFIKPKRYTLINKFCRDFYFRKYGVSISLDINYLDTPLYEKYDVKVLDKTKTPNHCLESMISNTKFRERVSKIVCSSPIKLNRYKMLRKIFPNIKKIMCVIIDYENIEDMSPVKGNILHIGILPTVYEKNSKKIRELIALGYKLRCSLRATVDVPEDISDSILKVCILYDTEIIPLNIGRFPNLKTLVLYGKTSLDSIIEEVINHPTIKQIRGVTNPKIRTIKKKNGNLVHIIGDTWNNSDDNIPDHTVYEMIKGNYKNITVNTPLLVDKLMEYERQSPIVKKMTLNLPSYIIDRERMLKILDLFNVKVTIKSYGLQSWLKEAKSYKVKFTEEGSIYKLYIGNGKLIVLHPCV